MTGRTDSDTRRDFGVSTLLLDDVHRRLLERLGAQSSTAPDHMPDRKLRLHDGHDLASTNASTAHRKCDCRLIDVHLGLAWTQLPSGS